jgi:DNA (cytosine-5)-methyltransferase 1
MKLKVLDLFSGIGGFSLGLHKTGKYETKAFCEWDKTCQSVLRKNFPGVVIYDDIKDLSLNEDSGYDVLVGGFPCQDLSLAGRGAGLEGDRSSHWFHYLRLIEESKPKGCIIENVSALRSRGLDTVLRGLDAVGYDAEWHCITAKHLGASHERDRLFVLAYRRCQGAKGFSPMVGLCKDGGPSQWGGESDLLPILQDPFGRSSRFPQPLLRGSDVRPAGWVDRLKQVGNSVYWPIVEKLGEHMYENLNG